MSCSASPTATPTTAGSTATSARSTASACARATPSAPAECSAPPASCRKIMRCCEDISGLCPDAWVVNYINPTAVCGMAVARNFPKLKSLALCDAQFKLRQRYAEIAGVPNDEKLVALPGRAQPFHLAAEGRVRRPRPDPADRRERPSERRGRRQPAVPGRLQPRQGLPQQHHRRRALRRVRRPAHRAGPHQGVRPLLPGPRQVRQGRRPPAENLRGPHAGRVDEQPSGSASTSTSAARPTSASSIPSSGPTRRPT